MKIFEFYFKKFKFKNAVNILDIFQKIELNVFFSKLKKIKFNYFS
jgi:hypothetical protein